MLIYLLLTLIILYKFWVYRFFYIVLMSLFLFFLTACSIANPPFVSFPSEGVIQKIAIRVLDKGDQPVPEAEIIITPLAGQPREYIYYLTDTKGKIQIEWLPEVCNKLVKSNNYDYPYIFCSKLSYRVIAKEFLDGIGILTDFSYYQRLNSPEFFNIDNQLAKSLLSETIVLRRFYDLFGEGLNQLSKDDKLVVACLNFFYKYQLVTMYLGADFAWPSFIYKDNILNIIFVWKGTTWGGFNYAPLVARIALNTAIPLTIAIGKDLLPLFNIERVVIQFWCELLSTENEWLVNPLPVRFFISAPVEAIRRLSKGDLAPDIFLSIYQPVIEILSQNKNYYNFFRY